VTWKRPNASLLGRERFEVRAPNRTLPTTYNLAYCAPPEPLSLTPSGEWTAWVKSSSGAAAATVNTLYGDRLGWAKVSVCLSVSRGSMYLPLLNPNTHRSRYANTFAFLQLEIPRSESLAHLFGPFIAHSALTKRRSR